MIAEVDSGVEKTRRPSGLLKQMFWMARPELLSTFRRRGVLLQSVAQARSSFRRGEEALSVGVVGGDVDDGETDIRNTFRCRGVVT